MSRVQVFEREMKIDRTIANTKMEMKIDGWEIVDRRYPVSSSRSFLRSTVLIPGIRNISFLLFLFLAEMGYRTGEREKRNIFSII